MPGPCDFPFVGTQTYAAGGFFWYCDGPVEENGSHWHAEGRGFNAGGPTGGGSYGGEFMGFGLTFPGGVVGGGGGFVGYVWPDGTPAPWPNPPGAWKDHLTPHLPPVEHRGPPPPPVPEEPCAVACPPVPNPPDYTGAVTNPDNPNPDATVNPEH
jgi:hypothetical protein